MLTDACMAVRGRRALIAARIKDIEANIVETNFKIGVLTAEDAELSLAERVLEKFGIEAAPVEELINSPWWW